MPPNFRALFGKNASEISTRIVAINLSSSSSQIKSMTLKMLYFL
ncbi:hypothetical protein HMPREF1139_1432 [Campylobacter sp. FOBRC14]|nr:hypothetical protein HMPREF1139_1432 [Campylobacter sp. FOBRC14]